MCYNDPYVYPSPLGGAYTYYTATHPVRQGGTVTSLWVAFVTGLTAGGLGCLAVQGGMLASSVAHRLEADVARGQPSDAAARGRRAATGHAAIDGQQAGAGAARPVLLFLGAKLVAYTALGFLLGALGSLLQLNAIARALLQLGVGIFMIGNALRNGGADHRVVKPRHQRDRRCWSHRRALPSPHQGPACPH